MNKIDSYETLKKMIIEALEDGRTLSLDNEETDKEFVFELLEFCREQLNK